MSPLLIPPPWRTAALRAATEAIPEATTAESVVPPSQVLRALTYFSPAETLVVILGQDPYPGVVSLPDGGRIAKASGLCFGISDAWRDLHTQEQLLTSSFGNLVAEVRRTYPRGVADFSLQSWARQGVLLLNADLTCRPGEPGSHRGVWRDVVRAIITQVPEDAVLVTLGAVARDTVPTRRPIDLATSHPCRHSAHKGFIGCNFAAGVNSTLRVRGLREIIW